MWVTGPQMSDLLFNCMDEGPSRDMAISTINFRSRQNAIDLTDNDIRGVQ